MTDQSWDIVWQILNSNLPIQVKDAEAVAQAKAEFLALKEQQGDKDQVTTN